MTSCSYRKPKILNVWEVDRETEVRAALLIRQHKPPRANIPRTSQGERFGENDSLENRRLLWHGTNIAVVAAILKSGLRIMPHSGGRVGRGIYFASENSKSAGYGEADSKEALNKRGCDRNYIVITSVFVVRTSKNTGVMFLCEVALGKESTITRDNPSLKKAPAGFDSVVARGSVEPGTLLLQPYYALGRQRSHLRANACFFQQKSEFKSHPSPPAPAREHKLSGAV